MLPSKQDQLKSVHRWYDVFNNEFDVFSPEFDEYQEGYNALAGNMYSDKQKSWYKAQRRPTHVWNLLLPMFNRILGDFLLNFTRERVFPKSAGSTQVAKLLEKYIETVSFNTDYKDEMAATIMAGLIKRGVVYPRFSNERELAGSPFITNVDEFEFLFDSRATRRLAEDGRYMIRSKWWTVEQIFAAWPQHKKELQVIMKDKESSAFLDSTTDFDAQMLTHKNFSDESNGKYRVLEVHYKVNEDVEAIFDPETTQTEILTLEGKRRELYLAQKPGARIITLNNRDKHYIDEVIPGLAFFCERREEEIQDGFWDYFIFSPYNYGKLTINNFGILRNSIGPNKSFNDHKNQSLNILNKSASSGQMLNPSGITNHRQVMRQGNEPGLNILLKDGYNFDQVYKRLDPPKYPYAEGKMAEDEYVLLNRITGLTENMQGQTQTSNENASLFAQRIREAQKAMVPVDKNIKYVVAHVWDRIIRLMQLNYTEERFLTLVNPIDGDVSEVAINQQAAGYVVNDIRLGEYYVHPTQEEINPTLRGLKFLQKTELIRMIIESLGATGVDFAWWLKNSDFEDINEAIAAAEKAQQAMMRQQGVEVASDSMAKVMQLAQQQQALQTGADNAVAVNAQSTQGGEQ